MGIGKNFGETGRRSLKSWIRSVLALLFLLVSVSASNATVYTYTKPPMPDNTQYSVKADGQTIAVTTFELYDGGGTYRPKPVAGFGFDGSVSVTVTTNFSFNSYAVRPDQYGISASRSGNSITFTLNDNTKGKVIVEFDNDYEKSLFLFADPPKPAVPSGARYIGPGYHTGHIYVGNNETVYLDAGAIVEGDINMHDVSNARVIGRGWYLGSLWVERTSNCEISGIHGGMLGKWTVNIKDSSFFNINHLKLLYLGNETDGISFNGTNNSTARHCFVMNADDVFTSQRAACYDNLTENVVVWSTGGGNIFGPGGTENIGGNNVYRDIYIVRGKNNFLTHHWSSGPGDIAGYTFENVYADPRVPFQSFIYINNVTNTGTRYYTLKNVHVPYAPSTVNANGSCNFTFDNLVMNGTRITSTSQMGLSSTGNHTYTFTNGTGSAPVGQVISIWSPAANSFVSTREDSASGYGYNPLVAMAPSVNAWERYRVDNAGGGYIALWSINRGRYVSVQADWADKILRAEWATSIGDWEKFSWQSLGGNKFALKSHTPGYYVSADMNGGGWLKAQWANSVGYWEEFNWDPQCLTATYFDNNNFTGATKTRRDSRVAFNWGHESPIKGIVPDTFSVRWTGRIIPKYSQAYTFYVNADDGVRLWINGQQIINSWTNTSGERKSTTITLTAKQLYSIKLEYYDNVGSARCQLFWESASQPKQIVPAEATIPT